MKNKELNIHEIKEKLAYFCAYQDRSHMEVEKKLNEFFLIPEARDEILLYLMRENFLNEERFARSYARGKFYQKSWGKIKIKQELKKRQINDLLISKAMSEIDEADYSKTARNLIIKKSNTLNEKNDYIRNQKLIRFMLQKGYEYEIIRDLLEEI